MVRETGIEPVRCNHTPLKRARLPVPPLPQEQNILYTKRPRLSRGFAKKISKNFSFLKKGIYSSVFPPFAALAKYSSSVASAIFVTEKSSPSG